VRARYGFAEYFDLRQAKKVRREIVDDLMFGWEPSEDDAEYEHKGDLSRVRLTGKEQILVTRIAEMFVRVR
jgi:hypothetical protein